MTINISDNTRIKAYVWANGVVDFGNETPEGAIEFANGQGEKFIESIQVLCRLAYPRYEDGKKQSDQWLMPGVPEAQNDEEASDAVVRFKQRIEARKTKANINE